MAPLLQLFTRIPVAAAPAEPTFPLNVAVPHAAAAVLPTSTARPLLAVSTPPYARPAGALLFTRKPVPLGLVMEVPVPKVNVPAEPLVMSTPASPPADRVVVPLKE
jgi:hypothetical protein